MNPDLTNKPAAARSAAATRGVDNRNNLEQVSIATLAAGQYRITVTHAGGLAGNPAPSTPERERERVSPEFLHKAGLIVVG